MPEPENIDRPDGTHQLAAVMFTDVVGFSSRTHANEAETLKLVAKDLRRIKEIAESHHGRVLKTMGDGVLIHFQSATDAVRCGMEFQTCMQSGFGPAKEKSPLQHRVGIHLGDMYVSESEVMGDGVNIASRLQTIAEPGGICVSQTVYDIIKNKVALKATHLGPRELKNISHAVHVYKIVIDAIEDNTEPDSNPMTQGRFAGWKDKGKDLATLADAIATKGRVTIRTLLPSPKHRIAAGITVLVLCSVLVGSYLMASKTEAPVLKELTTSQVEKALDGHTVNLGKILFVSTEGQIRRRDILAVTLKDTTWDAHAACYRSSYDFVLRVRGNGEKYRARIEHDGNQNVLDVKISGPY